ncbi:MAG: signal peptide peptidase SppA [Actinomycetota bacterium]
MSKKGWAIGISITAVLFLFACVGLAALLALVSAGSSSVPLGRKAVAVIHISGVIASSPQSGLLSATATATPENLIVQLRRADNDNNVAAVLLRVDSPGGSAAASQEIFKEVSRMKKPVMVSIADIGASGAYYISCGADEIMASPASSVGSIGVIIQVANLEELYKKLGIQYVTIKQGKYKDMGSGDRALTDEERKLLEQETEEVYDQFITDVASSRNIPEETVRELATGQTWNGSKAKDLALIDSIGNYRDAVKRAGQLGKIEGEPSVISYDQTSIWDILAGVSSAGALSDLTKLLGLLNGTQSMPVSR